MKKENIDFFVSKMSGEGFQVKRFPSTPEDRPFVGFQLYADNNYIDSIVISDSIKDDCFEYLFVKFIVACKTIAIYKSRARRVKDNDTIR